MSGKKKRGRPKEGKRTKTSFYIDDADLTILREISGRTEIPISRLLRKAIKNVILEHSKK